MDGPPLEGERREGEKVREREREGRISPRDETFRCERENSHREMEERRGEEEMTRERAGERRKRGEREEEREKKNGGRRVSPRDGNSVTHEREREKGRGTSLSSRRKFRRERERERKGEERVS